MNFSKEIKCFRVGRETGNRHIFVFVGCCHNDVSILLQVTLCLKSILSIGNVVCLNLQPVLENNNKINIFINSKKQIVAILRLANWLF